MEVCTPSPGSSQQSDDSPPQAVDWGALLEFFRSPVVDDDAQLPGGPVAEPSAERTLPCLSKHDQPDDPDPWQLGSLCDELVPGTLDTCQSQLVSPSMYLYSEDLLLDFTQDKWLSGLHRGYGSKQPPAIATSSPQGTRPLLLNLYQLTDLLQRRATEIELGSAPHPTVASKIRELELGFPTEYAGIWSSSVNLAVMEVAGGFLQGKFEVRTNAQHYASLGLASSSSAKSGPGMPVKRRRLLSSSVPGATRHTPTTSKSTTTISAKQTTLDAGAFWGELRDVPVP